MKLTTETQRAQRFFGEPLQFIPSNAAAIWLHLFTCLLLTAGYVLTKIGF